MTMTTINDLYLAYADGCGPMGPDMDRDALRADYQAWAAAREVSARYEETGQQYLDDMDLGPWGESKQEGRPAASSSAA